MTPDYQQHFTRIFQELADAAGKIALHYFRSDLTIEAKDDLSPVTEADRAIELKLREIIEKAFPTHGFIGEEFGTSNISAEFVWVVDPIDGTRAFMTGKPLFGTLIGLMHGGKPMVGLIEQPFTKERWFGIDSEWAEWNGKRIHVSPSRRLEDARLYAGSPHMFGNDDADTYLKLCRTARWLQYGCDCYAYGLMAMGCADLVVEQKLKIYDVAGIAPIITGAGGFFYRLGTQAGRYEFQRTYYRCNFASIGL
jgi:histidinol phosphatase-like enzyme (inositol monophosphatase family)